MAAQLQLPKPTTRRRRFQIIGLSITVAASGWMLLASDHDLPSYYSYTNNNDDAKYDSRRQLLVPLEKKESGGSGHHHNNKLFRQNRNSKNNASSGDPAADESSSSLFERNLASSATVAARGSGPELAALDGALYKFNERPHQGVMWYELLSSPKLQWNMSPHRWNNCPDGANVFLGDTGFSFHEILEDPDASPDDAEIVRSKQLRFSVGRKDHRECLWNYSKSCLAGGSFVMNLGAMSRDMLYPGDFTLKTLRNEDNGPIRIVAYNTNTACMLRTHDESHNIQMKGRLIDQENTREAHLDKPPIDYLRRSISSTMDPEGCERWIEERTSNDDLFAFNSDMSTVHVDTPWLQIIVQVRQNKVATKTSCSYAAMNVWITDISPELLEEDIAGLLGDATLAARGRRKQRGRRLNQQMVKGNGNRVRSDHDVHLVDGPFDSPMTSSHF
eukprot:CAMPEP_0183712004 /NCGR_PEP_ID=MMETSP0737-20130205/7298_1 /TAXON_ID=385413 /ORGANISM="Thalassiosira miniscula, Strain CCMP1093" /LENGTH=444 /DNA_ID=CAMNT_0025940579 /DNA_START=4 /DNA_END=1338 /DNA_ORIENTATION=-